MSTFVGSLKNPSNFNVYYGSKGRQGQHTYYVTTMKLREIYNNFKFYLERPFLEKDIEVLDPAPGRQKKKVVRLREASIKRDAQRIRDPNKVDEIIDYLRKNHTSWIFSSITASCDGEVTYLPLKEDDRVGKICIRKGTDLLINDGQHRADAIGQVWTKKLLHSLTEDFGDQSISVVIFETTGLARSQQMFVDLQKGTSVNKSLQSELSPEIDHRLIREVRDAVPIFKSYISTDQTSVAKGSRKLFTQGAFYEANKYIFDGELQDEKSFKKLKVFMVEFWRGLSENIVGWEDFCETDRLDTDEFRSENLSHLTLSLHAFGMIGARMYHKELSLDRLKRLSKVDWTRDNEELMDVVTTKKNKIANNYQVRRALRDYLWQSVLGYSAWGDE